jgi:hypothetical protein
MATNPNTTSALHEPVDYASPGTFRRGRRLQVVGVASLVISILSLLIYGYLFKVAYDTTSLGKLGVAQGKRGSYWGQYSNDQKYGSDASIVVGVLIGSSSLLVVAAILSILSKRVGVPVHHFYAVVQILASIALANVCMSWLYDSPGGPLY